MYSIRKISAQITIKEKEQILQLVKENANLVSVNVFNTSTNLYTYLCVREILKTEMYLNRVIENEPRATHLIVTEDKYQNIIGYILFHKCINQLKDASIIQTVVSAKHRRQGLLRRMLNVLKEDCLSVSLSCFRNVVEIYERLGFRIVGQWQTQIGMLCGNDEGGQVVTIDDSLIDKEKSVLDELSKLKYYHSDSWKDGFRELNFNNQKESQLVSTYLKEKLDD